MATKKPETTEEKVETTEEVKTPRIAHDFQRDDLNDLRDAVNELFEKQK
jgi:hypothetical protein